MRIWAILALTSGLWANDGSMILGIGGLVPLQSTAVRMEREQLEISTREIRVRYWFRNVTAKTELVRVGFPLPRINGGLIANSPIEIPARGENFTAFQVWVDGVERRAEREVRAFDQNGAEITAQLSKYNLAGELLFPWVQISLLRLPDKVHAQFEENGWIDCHRETAGQHCMPFWQEDHTYHWEQEFPPGKLVRVEHRYRPVVGAISPLEKFPEDFTANPAYCLSLQDALAIGPLAKGMRVTQDQIDYILKNARSWKGPIGDFHLVIDGGQETTVLSTCFGGLKKVAPGRWEFRARNFVPDEDLRILLLSKSIGRVY